VELKTSRRIGCHTCYRDWREREREYAWNTSQWGEGIMETPRRVPKAITSNKQL